MTKLDSKQRKHILDKLSSIKREKISEFAPHYYDKKHDTPAIKKARAKIEELEAQIQSHESAVEEGYNTTRDKIYEDFNKLEDQIILGESTDVLNLLTEFRDKTY